MLLLDTNAILRYVLQDNQIMADEVERQLSCNICFVPVEVVAEVIYVLLKVYKVDRDVIAKTVTDIMSEHNITVAHESVVLHALRIFASTTIDFVDCLLAGYAKKEGYTVLTFDKKLQKLLNE